jgi:hypothetical protein
VLERLEDTRVHRALAVWGAVTVMSAMLTAIIWSALRDQARAMSLCVVCVPRMAGSETRTTRGCLVILDTSRPFFSHPCQIPAAGDCTAVIAPMPEHASLAAGPWLG